MRRFRGRGTRFGVALLGLVLLGGAAAAGWRALAPPGCEPRTLADWRAAMRQSCVSRSYVCENMTAIKLLSDPELVARYHAALLGGERDAALQLETLVAHLRAAYGCASAPVRRLPPGHPPIDTLPGGAPAVPLIFEPPASVDI